MATRNQANVKPVLSNIAVQYRQAAAFIADQIFPVVSVNGVEVGEYWVYGKEAYDLVRTRRAPDTPAAEIDYKGTQAEYNCQEYALRTHIGRRERANDNGPLVLERRKTELVTDGLLLDREARMAAMINDTALWTDESPGTKWDAAGSTFVLEIKAAKEIMRKASGGKLPNTAIIPQLVLNALEESAEIMARLSSAALQITTLDVIRALIGIPNILVPGGLYNTAKEGQTASLTDIWGDNVSLLYVAPSPSKEVPSAGYTFAAQNLTVESWYNNDIKATYIEAYMIEDMKQVCADCGYLFTNVLT